MVVEASQSPFLFFDVPLNRCQPQRQKTMQKNDPPENVLPFTAIRFEDMLRQGIEQKIGVDSSISVQMPVDQNLSLAHEEGFLADVVDQVISVLSESLENIAITDNIRFQAHQIDAKLRCSHCGETTEGIDADCDTYLRKDQDDTLVRVGDSFEINPAKCNSDHYIIANPVLDETRLLEGWWCEECSNINWAEITIHQGRVRSIWTVIFSEELFSRVNYVSSEMLEVVAELANRPVWSIGHEETLEILREELEPDVPVDD